MFKIKINKEDMEKNIVVNDEYELAGILQEELEKGTKLDQIKIIGESK